MVVTYVSEGRSKLMQCACQQAHRFKAANLWSLWLQRCYHSVTLAVLLCLAMEGEETTFSYAKNYHAKISPNHVPFSMSLSLSCPQF